MSFVQWRDHFERNRLRVLPELRGAAEGLPAQWPALLARSLAVFQLGESKGGRLASEIDSIPGLDGDYRADSPVAGSLLQCDGPAERRAQQDDRTGRNRAQGGMEIVFFEESVGACGAAGLAVAAAVVRNHVESSRTKAPNHSRRTRSIVGGPMEVHDRATPHTVRGTPPAFQHDACSRKDGILTGIRWGTDHSGASRVQQAAGTDDGELRQNETADHREYDADDPERERPAACQHVFNPF